MTDEELIRHLNNQVAAYDDMLEVAKVRIAELENVVRQNREATIQELRAHSWALRQSGASTEAWWYDEVVRYLTHRSVQRLGEGS